MYSDLYFFCTPFDKLLFKGICSFCLFLFRYYWHLIYIFASAQHNPNHNHNMSRKHLLPYIITKILFLVMKIFKMYILHNFQIYDIVLLTIFHHALHYTALPNWHPHPFLPPNMYHLQLLAILKTILYIHKLRFYCCCLNSTYN